MKYLVKQACQLEVNGRTQRYEDGKEVDIPESIEQLADFEQFIAVGWMIPLEYRPAAPAPKAAKPPVKAKPPQKKAQKPISADVPNPEVVA